MILLKVLGVQPTFYICVHAKSLQSCPTLCDPTDCSLTGSSVHGDSPGKSNGEGCHAILQGISPTQGSNPGLLHCRRSLYQLGYQESPEDQEPQGKSTGQQAGQLVP